MIKSTKSVDFFAAHHSDVECFSPEIKLEINRSKLFSSFPNVLKLSVAQIQLKSSKRSAMIWSVDFKFLKEITNYKLT